MSEPKKNLLNLGDLQYSPLGDIIPGQPESYGARIAPIGAKLGAQKLGYNVTVLPPGKKAFPFHCHRVNEEMFFILEGEGEIRVGETRHPIRSGDVIACPPGGPETAHQITNTSAAELKYLAVSTRQWPEVVEYPDSGKFGVLAEYPMGADGKSAGLRFVSRVKESLGYWDGE